LAGEAAEDREVVGPAAEVVDSAALAAVVVRAADLELAEERARGVVETEELALVAVVVRAVDLELVVAVPAEVARAGDLEPVVAALAVDLVAPVAVARAEGLGLVAVEVVQAEVAGVEQVEVPGTAAEEAAVQVGPAAVEVAGKNLENG
jgi:hypothetical protein